MRTLALLLASLLTLAPFGCTYQRAYWVPIANNPRHAETLACEDQCSTSSKEGSDSYFACLKKCPNVRVYETACQPESERGHCHNQSERSIAPGILIGLGFVAILAAVAVNSLQGIHFGGGD